MRFQKNQRRKAIEYEKDLVRYWEKNKIFEKSISQRSDSNMYVFYDGPPFITGVPHYGTLLSSIVKDAIPRFWTMKGMRVERRWGWDCHGLPAEVFTEKKLDIKDKRDIGTKITLEKYILTCRSNMVETGNLWEDTINRIGRWVDFKGAYKTMDKDYMESVWWAFKQLYEKGKIYEGEKVLLYCTRDATPISKAEVAMDNSYQEDTDPSVYVKFRLKDWSHVKGISSNLGNLSAKEDKPQVYLLAWTTTPWTLHSNTAIAINSDVKYSLIKYNDEYLIIASNLLKRVMTDEKHQALDYVIITTFNGKELVGKEYEPLFNNRGNNAHKIWHADFVHTEEGTGIAHESPAYGEDDYILAKNNNIPIVIDTDDEGQYIDGPWKGKQVWDCNKEIAKELLANGVVWKIEYIRHSYPHCHRCGTKLMYRAHPSWFMDIENQKFEMLENNRHISWYPEHIKDGRFAKTVENAPDWNLSRDRFWATAMPVWKGIDREGKEHVKVVGSYAELKELSGVELDDYHRPWIDDVTFTIDDVEYKRIDKVLDCWFESGSMPFAQFHYPFENTDKFETNFPGDFISEYVGQVRAWFYYVHAVSVGLFGQNAFKNVVVTGTIAGNDGRKMSKSYGNYTDPNELMDQYSADALRFLLLSSPLLNGEDFSLKDKEVNDIHRKLSMIWNMYDFFTLYAEIDNWEWDGELNDPTSSLDNLLDLWIVSRVHQLNKDVGLCMESYNVSGATKPILEFVDDASNWYVRRSRKRFWKSQNDEDKSAAYKTLHYVLVQLAIIMAPFTPFLSEELYRNLTGKESVHLLDWPNPGHVEQLITNNMAVVRDLITQGLSQRAQASIKVRQPLASADVVVPFTAHKAIIDEFKSIICEELNLHEINFTSGMKASISVNTSLTDELKQEGLARELIRHIQNARKEAGFQIDDRIELAISSDDDSIVSLVRKFTNQIKRETLSITLNDEIAKVNGYSQIVNLGDTKVTLSMKVTTTS